MATRLTNLLLRRGSILLMWALIGLTIASPLADSNPYIGVMLALLILSLFVAGASLYSHHKVMVRLVLPLCVLWFLVRVLEECTHHRHFFSFLAHLTGIGLSGMTIAALFRRLGAESRAPSSVVAGAFNIYLLIAFAFGQLYWIVNDMVPGSFNQYIAPRYNTEFLYFSMVTLTTIGYGGIAPVNPFVRIVAGFEGMSGIFYIAVVVARIVSSFHPIRNDFPLADDPSREAITTEPFQLH